MPQLNNDIHMTSMTNKHISCLEVNQLTWSMKVAINLVCQLQPLAFWLQNALKQRQQACLALPHLRLARNELIPCGDSSIPIALLRHLWQNNNVWLDIHCLLEARKVSNMSLVNWLTFSALESRFSFGGVSELADEHDLGSCAERRGGSNPPFPMLMCIY